MHSWRDIVCKRLEKAGIDPVADATLIEELAHHMDDRYTESIAGGATPDQALADGLRELDDDHERLAPELVTNRAARLPVPALGGPRLSSRIAAVLQDIRYAVRSNARFTLAVLLLLAVGVGATTAMFSVVNGVLLRPLPLPDPGQLMLIGERVPQMPQTNALAWFVSAPAFVTWQGEAKDFIGVSAIISSRLPVMGGGEPRMLYGARASPNFFDMLQVPAAMGRTFEPDDARDTANPIIITDALWRTVFNADSAIIGRNIGMPGSSARVIGVLPAGFPLHGRQLGPMFEGRPTEFFRPLQLGPAVLRRPDTFGDFSYHVIGRVRPGVTSDQALAQLNAIQANLARTAPDKLSRFADLTTLQDFAVAGGGQELWLLLGGSGAVLLIICVNLGGLWISRLSDRQREWGIRTALGADPTQLALQILGESITLGLVGGILGIGCAALSLHTLLAAAPANLPRIDEVHIEGRVLVFGLVLAVLSGLLTGLVPALRLARLHPQAALSHGSGSATSSLAKRPQPPGAARPAGGDLDRPFDCGWAARIELLPPNLAAPRLCGSACGGSRNKPILPINAWRFCASFPRQLGLCLGCCRPDSRRYCR